MPATSTVKSIVRRSAGALSFRNISAVYILIALVVIFSLWIPNIFLTGGVWRSLIDDSALTAIVAIALVLPLAAGSFNLAIGTEVGMGAVLVAWLIELRHVPVVPGIALTLLGGCVIGSVTAFLIIRAKIDSFIATLGMSSVLLAVIAWVSGSQQILNLPQGFAQIGTGELLGLTYPVWIMLGVAVVVFYVLERTPVGRHVYATGGNLAADC